MDTTDINPVNNEAYARLLDEEQQRLVEKLRELGASLIILFGSRTRGRADLLTDLDLLVVLESELPFVERTVWAYRQLAPRVASDILIYTPLEWETIKEKPFFLKSVREGRVLYAQGTTS